jgi:uncharacterized protein YlzI (FlbEa/FlbD family)
MPNTLQMLKTTRVMIDEDEKEFYNKILEYQKNATTFD